MYTLLHGALKNVGDFLIYERAKQLLRTHQPEHDFLEFSRYESLEPHLNAVNQTDAVILCGGPGYREDFYPRIFALTEELSRIKPPIIPFGLGWSGYPAGYPGQFRFTRQSLEAIQFIHQRIPQSTCRDVLTLGILQRYGINNVVMSGCPAWYYLPLIHAPFRPPERIRRVVVTTPRRIHLIPQAILLLHRVRREFPTATRYCVFHRGYRHDAHTRTRKALALRFLNYTAQALRYNVVNAAYNLSKINFYADCDLHIGYRVHAQINFLSLRKPSLLLCEDSRGEGLSRTLDLGDVRAYDNPHAVAQTMQRLRQDLTTNFCRFERVTRKMQETYERAMLAFLHTLP